MFLTNIKWIFILVFAQDATNHNEVSNKNRSAPIAFCRPCRKKHSKDILEIISYGVVGGIASDIYSISELKQAEDELKSLPGIDIRLDYHGVLDTINKDVKLGYKRYEVCDSSSDSEDEVCIPIYNDRADNICCISYVGQLTTTRISAREDMMDRMRSSQILLGILVFARGSKRFPEEGDRFVDPGSKGWANKLIPYNNKPIFIDDSEDHVKSVQFVGIDSYLFSPSDNLVQFLDNIMN